MEEDFGIPIYEITRILSYPFSIEILGEEAGIGV